MGGASSLATMIGVKSKRRAMSPAFVILIVYIVSNHCTGESFVDRRCMHSSKAEGVCVPWEDCDRDGVVIGNHVPDRTKGYIRCPGLTCCLLAPPSAATESPGVLTTRHSESCGVLKGASVSINDVTANQVPWNVALMIPSGFEDSKYRMLFLANGVLIHERVVMTSALNVRMKILPKTRGRTYWAVLGDYDQRKPTPGRKVLKVEKHIVHDMYNQSTKQHNIALAILSRSTRAAGLSITPACLPPANHVVPDETRCFFTGWGKDGHDLHQARLVLTKVPIVENDRCSIWNRGKDLLGERYRVPATLMCAGGEPDQDLCTGDGGSPLVCPTLDAPDQYMVVGMMAYVSRVCGPVARPAAFTQVSNFVSWIHDHIAKELPSSA